MQKKYHPKKGFTLLEVAFVLAISAIVLGIVVPTFASFREQAQIEVDLASTASLTRASQLYAIEGGRANQADIFEGYENNQDRLNQLLQGGFMAKKPRPQHKESEFAWSIDKQVWKLSPIDDSSGTDPGPDPDPPGTGGGCSRSSR